MIKITKAVFPVAGMVLFISALLLIIGIDSAIQFFLNLRQGGPAAKLGAGETAP